MQEMQQMWVRSLGQEDPPGGDNSNPLQYSCLENSMERGAWWATVHGVAKSRSQWSMHTQISTRIQSSHFILSCYVS